MKEISKAIIGVMKEVQFLEKRSRVGTGNSAYDGTKDQDVKEAFNEAFIKHGLSILPIGIKDEIKIDRWEEVDPYSKSTPKDLKTKQSVFTSVTTRYLLLHISGESIELSGYGHGIDTQDKGAGKATTYALKNCLINTFLTPVGKAEDTDTTHSNDIPTPPIKKQEPKQVLKLPLVEGSDAWTKCVVALKNGWSTDDLAKKYIITEEISDKLINQASI